MKNYKAGDRFKLNEFKGTILGRQGGSYWMVRADPRPGCNICVLYHIHDDDMPEKEESRPEQGFKVGDKVWWNSSSAVVVSARWSGGMWNYTLDYESNCGTPLSVVVERCELAKRPA